MIWLNKTRCGREKHEECREGITIARNRLISISHFMLLCTAKSWNNTEIPWLGLQDEWVVAMANKTQTGTRRPDEWERPINRSMSGKGFLSQDERDWKSPCSSQISPYVSRVKSGINTGNVQLLKDERWATHWMAYQPIAHCKVSDNDLLDVPTAHSGTSQFRPP